MFPFFHSSFFPFYVQFYFLLVREKAAGSGIEIFSLFTGEKKIEESSFLFVSKVLLVLHRRLSFIAAKDKTGEEKREKCSGHNPENLVQLSVLCVGLCGGSDKGEWREGYAFCPNVSEGFSLLVISKPSYKPVTRLSLEARATRLYCPYPLFSMQPSSLQLGGGGENIYTVDQFSFCAKHTGRKLMNFSTVYPGLAVRGEKCCSVTLVRALVDWGIQISCKLIKKNDNYDLACGSKKDLKNFDLPARDVEEYVKNTIFS